MPQPLQEQPQEQPPLPFFRFRIPLIIIVRNNTAMIAAITNVGQFMEPPPNSHTYFCGQEGR